MSDIRARITALGMAIYRGCPSIGVGHAVVKMAAEEAEQVFSAGEK